MSCRVGPGLLVALFVEIAWLAAACGGGETSGDPEHFTKFADRIAQAAEKGDVAFFTGRVEGTTYTCTEDDVTGTPAPGGPQLDLCLEPGQQFESVFVGGYPFGQARTTTERLVQDLTRFFRDAQADQEDEYGPGRVRLYATAASAPADEPRREIAVLTALHPSRELTATPVARAVRALYFQYLDGRWVITGAVLAGPPLAVDLLEASLVPSYLEEWKKR